MSNLHNPFAFTLLGQSMGGSSVRPQLRVMGEGMTGEQHLMARKAFADFCTLTRTSFVPNPVKNGRLPDGSRYRITQIGREARMEVWPEFISSGGSQECIPIFRPAQPPDPVVLPDPPAREPNAVLELTSVITVSVFDPVYLGFPGTDLDYMWYDSQESIQELNFRVEVEGVVIASHNESFRSLFIYNGQPFPLHYRNVTYEQVIGAVARSENYNPFEGSSAPAGYVGLLYRITNYMAQTDNLDKVVGTYKEVNASEWDHNLVTTVYENPLRSIKDAYNADVSARYEALLSQYTAKATKGIEVNELQEYLKNIHEHLEIEYESLIEAGEDGCPDRPSYEFRRIEYGRQLARHSELKQEYDAL